MNTTQAVQRCLDAYTRARSLAGPEDKALGPFTMERINLAYRRAMPFLTPDPDAIDAFIACVTHGLILQVFTPAEASKLLYAAQIAISSNRARIAARKAESKPQTQGAPSMATASSSPWVGEHEPQPATLPLRHSAAPTTPTPLGTKGAEGAVGHTAGTPTPPPCLLMKSITYSQKAR